MIRPLILSLMLLLPMHATAQTGDAVTGFATDDAEMSAAQEAAGLSLPLFLANATNDEGFGRESAAVKVAFEVDVGQSEVIWVSPIFWDGEQGMIGLLSNQPNFMGSLNAGDQVGFDLSMVRDWSLAGADGKIYGNYTTRVMLAQLDAETAAQLRDALSAVPVPSEWN